MGITTQLKTLIMGRVTTLGITPDGGLWPPDDIPDCARNSGDVYAEYSWIGVKDDRTAGELFDEYFLQFQFFGDVEDDVNDAIDEFADALDRCYYNLNGITTTGGSLFMNLDRGAPKIPAMKSNDKERTSKYSGICQFRIRAGKSCTTTT